MNKYEKVIQRIVKIFVKGVSKKIKSEELERKSVKLVSKEYKVKPQIVYAIFGKVAEDAGNYEYATKYYKKVGTPEYNLKSAKMHEKSKASNSIDSIVTVIMTLSGLGVLYQLFSNAAVTATTSNQLLAPPFPNSLIYVLPLVFIAGAMYFLWKKARKDLIPLSFR